MQIDILNSLKKLKEINFYRVYRAERKKIGLLAIIFSLVLVYYLSLNIRYRIREDVLYWENQALLSKNLSLRVNSEEEIVSVLQEEYRLAKRITYLSEQDILRLVTLYAQRMNMHVNNVNIYPCGVLRNMGKNAVVINSRAVQSFLVQIDADGGYLNLMKYLDTLQGLQRMTSALVTVERLKVSKDKRNPEKLRVKLEFRFYNLLSGA